MEHNARRRRDGDVLACSLARKMTRGQIHGEQRKMEKLPARYY